MCVCVTFLDPLFGNIPREKNSFHVTYKKKIKFLGSSIFGNGDFACEGFLFYLWAQLVRFAQVLAQT